MSVALALIGLTLAALLFFAAYRFGPRGALICVGAPFAMLVWLWLALKFYWIQHTGDDDAEVILYIIVMWVVFAGLCSGAGLAFRRN